jgi:GT2 family glycosyltransferase
MKPRILMCITVYNGRAFVRRTLESAKAVDTTTAEVDVLVLDDCSPEPGWSDELAGICAELAVEYYRTPRNLGIPRNVNLGLLAAVNRNYDYVMICNSDVLFPSNLIEGLLACVDENENVGSVTAWSNNVSLYSIPNSDPDQYLSNQGVVDWVSASLAGNYRGAVMDIPAGISFCILIPTAVVREVGLMDPVFNRGYCEETDWTLRSQIAGYRICLAPGVFVYHEGGGTNRDAGLVAEGETTVPQNERIIDLRYPHFRRQVEAFVSSGILQQAHTDAALQIAKDAGHQFGYDIEVGWLPRDPFEGTRAKCVIAPDGKPDVLVGALGFAESLKVEPIETGIEVRKFFDREPDAVNLYDRGVMATRFRDEDDGATNFVLYPTKV